MVLVDTGANEVVRPHSERDLWQIENEAKGTRKTKVRLAGGKWYEAGMTVCGEYMLGPSNGGGYAAESRAKGPWILPMIRGRRELGLDLTWWWDGCWLSGGQCTEPIKCELIKDLPYITWEQFEDIRLALASSHKCGRKAIDRYVYGPRERPYSMNQGPKSNVVRVSRSSRRSQRERNARRKEPTRAWSEGSRRTYAKPDKTWEDWDKSL